jgi:ABC-2 type transport system ATP-binding protein
MNEEIIIQVRELTKHFGDLVAVNGISLQVKKGEIFGFLGPNGSGKTTTIRMLCGLLIPDAGYGYCLGYNILTETLKIKARVGYMTQRFSYYDDLTVFENLQFTARIYQINAARNRIEKVISDFGFSGRRNQLAGNLSGGWKQRLALAASLLHKPDLLLLDEPTAGVDPEARREFWDKIHELSNQGVTTLVSTHYMDEAERCTRLAYIAYGELLQEGTITEIADRVNLTAYSIKGEGLAELSRWMKAHFKQLQVVIFGEILHVSSDDRTLMETVITKIPNKKNFSIEKRKASLEDVFIRLVGQTRHEKHLD